MSAQPDVVADIHPGIPADSRRSDATGRFFIPGLLAMAVACQVIADLQLLRYLDRAPVVVLTSQMTPLVTALAWAIRHRARSQRVRAVCSLVAFVSAAAPSAVGRLGFEAPALILASALLVVDMSLRAGLAVNLVFVGLESIIALALGRDPLLIAAMGGSFLVLLWSGSVLGLVLSRYDAVLADQRQALAERDAALARAERQAVIEKELLLAEERARAAHELHDGLGHRLTQIGMSLEFAARVRERDPEAAWKEIAVAEAASREAVGEMRTWVRALSPASPAVLSASRAAGGDLDETENNSAEAPAGAAGLDAVAASFRGTGVRVDVTDEIGPGVLTEEAELLVYRAVQEGLINAVRHSRARAIEIRLASVTDGPGTRAALGSSPTHVDLEVTNLIPAAHRADVPEAAVGERGGPEPGFGVGGLSRRANELGGTATAGREGNTFRLRLRLPSHTALSPQEAS